MSAQLIEDGIDSYGDGYDLDVRLPEVIPIKYEPDYRTDRIGRYAGGQFFADVTGTDPEGVAPGDDWRDQQRIYAVLHLFDGSGRHTGSRVWFAGVRADSPAVVGRAEQVLANWLSPTARVPRTLERRVRHLTANEPPTADRPTASQDRWRERRDGRPTVAVRA